MGTVCTSLLLCACRAPTTSGEKVVRLWKAAQGEQRQDWEDVIQPFLEAHPDLRVEVLSHPRLGRTLCHRLQRRHTARFSLHARRVLAALRRGWAVAALDERFPAAIARMREEYPPSLWRLGSLRGRQYGIPYLYVSYQLLYNRDLFDRAGLPPPPATPDAPGFDSWTWERFLEVGRALTQDLDGDGRTDQWGFAWGSLEGHSNALYPFLWQGGADLLTPDGTRNALMPRAVVGLRFIQRMAKERLIPEGGLHPGPADLFYRGRAAMYLTASTVTRILDRDFPDLPVGAAIVPQGPATDFYEGRGTFGNVGFWVVSAASPHAEEAFALLSFLNDRPQVDAMMRRLLLFGARLDWRPAAADPLLETFISGRRYLVPYPLHPRLRVVHSVIQAEVQSMLLGRKTPDEAAAEAARAIDALLSLR